jgi:Tannase and feruloyl esterase
MRDVALLPKIIGTTKGGKSMQSKSSQYLRLAAVPACLLTATLAHAGQNAPLCTDLPFAYTAADVELTSATLVAAVAGRNPEYCDVRGTINRHIKFAVFLPTEWNQRFQMVGNGGKAGTISLSDMATAVANGFATSSTDTGHDAASPIEGGSRFGNDAIFGKEREIDFGWRAVHLTAKVSKDIITTYYVKRKLNYSYWNGCSTGGRQGLMEAQRFPDDFDGYLVGAPVYNYTGQQMSAPATLTPLYKRIPPTSTSDGPVISPAKRNMIGAAVYARCDALDGLVDGQIRNPLTCDFDPARHIPACSATSGPACLTSTELAALQQVYAGKEPFVPAPIKGAESIPGGWSSWILPNNNPVTGAPGTPLLHSVIADAFEWLMFNPDRPGFDYLTQFDWNADPFLMHEAEQIFNATDPDLRDVMHKGKKILMYHGFSDPGANGVRTIRYREAVIAFMNEHLGNAHGHHKTLGETFTDRFLRLYMVPGMAHCGGGVGHSNVDWLTPLMHWVEDGAAPEAIVGTKPGTTSTRPHCPYPQEAVYNGGDPNVASSFSCRTLN